MPLNLGYFFIRQPRVSPINAVTTLPPSSEGDYLLEDAFKMEYLGSNFDARLSVTGKKILTLIDEDPSHPDNLDLPVIGMNIGEVVEEINSIDNYSASSITVSGGDLCLFETMVREDISSPKTIRYNKELEWMIDTHAEGKIGTASVAVKEENFGYSDINSKWVTDEGFIYDEKDVVLDSSGKAPLGDYGVYINFDPAIESTAKDISRTVEFEDLDLVASLDQATPRFIFNAAPVLIDETLLLKINQIEQEENTNYRVSYGVAPEIIGSVSSPYNIVEGKNTLRIRHNSDDIQEFVIPVGQYTPSQLASLINMTSLDFKAYPYKDDDTNEDFLSLRGDRGTQYHQLRIEEGTSNDALGFVNQEAVMGEGVGEIHYLSHIVGEDITPSGTVNETTVDAINKIPDNPFLGVNVENFQVFEDGIELVQGKDFLVNTTGTIKFTSSQEEEDLTSGVLTLDDSLFPDDYVLRADGVKLYEGTDYRINPQGGWITLSATAFPGSVYTLSYTSSTLGWVEDEVILGYPAKLISGNNGPYNLVETGNILKISINSQTMQEFELPLSKSAPTSTLVSLVNASATGFVAYDYEGGLAFDTIGSGSTYSITVGDGSANPILGLSNNQSAEGTGAKGGEKAIDAKNPPMMTGGFTAPQGGDTIIIQDNDVSDRYQENTLIKLLNDYYQVKESVIVDTPNIIGAISGEVSILKGSNDTFIFTANDEEPTRVILGEGLNRPLEDIVDDINSVRPESADVLNINGSDKIRIRSNEFLRIEDGNANRSIGFASGATDTDAPDTFIVVKNLFKTTYVNPEMYTSVDPVDLTQVVAKKDKAPQGENTLVFEGNLTTDFRKNVLIKVANIFYHEVRGSSYDPEINKTEVKLGTSLGTPVYLDTLIERTLNPVFTEGTDRLKTKMLPALSESYSLTKNGYIQKPDQDYEITDSGDIDLTLPMINGDVYKITYIGKEFITGDKQYTTSYTYFDYVRVGSNINISYKADNTDNFFVNVLHASTLMSRFEKDLAEKNQGIANSSSSGFPTGTIPVINNDDSGSESFTYKLGNIDDMTQLSQGWYDFFDTRITYFEDERRLLTGFRVGAEDGKVTQYEIANAVNTPPQRLYPLPDTRPEEERVEPLKVPALFGENKNDGGSDAQGRHSDNISDAIISEKINLDSEVSYLTYLLGRSTSSHTLYSGHSGPYTFGATRTLGLYIEATNPTTGVLDQRNVGVTLEPDSPHRNPQYPPNLPEYITDPRSTSYVVSKINQAVNSAFGYIVNPASGSSRVALSATSGGRCKCSYITQDVPELSFGEGNEAAIRSRSTVWTGGAIYSIVIPGSSSAHLANEGGSFDRNIELTQHLAQVTKLEGQMEEWLDPLTDSFYKAKDEKIRVRDFITKTSYFETLSNDFSNLKFSKVLDAIDSDTVLADRIASISPRKNDDELREDGIYIRDVEIQESLASENMFEPRYSWLVILSHRNNGYYADRKAAIDTEERRLRQAANNKDTLGSIGTYS